jgi:hypothetical protein
MMRGSRLRLDLTTGLVAALAVIPPLAACDQDQPRSGPGVDQSMPGDGFPSGPVKVVMVPDGPGAPPGAGTGSDGATDDAGGGGATNDAQPDDEPIVPGVKVKHPVDAFSEAPPFSAALPERTANSHHPAPVTLKDCLSCHDGSGPAPLFDFAGTIWLGDDESKPAAGAEIRQIDANDIAYSTHADADGNFWHRAEHPLDLPSLSGVRDGNGPITGMLNGTSCNHCHDAGFKLHTKPSG